MVISISYLPSNAISAYIQAQTGVASQNAATPDPLAAAQNTSTTPQTDTSQSGTASVITQLSVPGQVKSTLADLQDKAVALKSFSASPNVSDFQIIVQGFTQAFNSLNQNIKALLSRQSTPSTDNRPSQALYDVRKAAAGDNGNSLAALQKLGVAPQANGTLSIDRNQLANSYQNNHAETVATISALANRVAQAADKNLSGNAADAQIASGTAPYSNVAETPVSGNAASNAIIDKQVNAAIDKQVDAVSTHVSQPENTVNNTAKSSAETHTQQPVQPSPPATSSPPVQTHAPVSNTAHTAVATYTSVAAV